MGSGISPSSLLILIYRAIVFRSPPPLHSGLLFGYFCHSLDLENFDTKITLGTVKLLILKIYGYN
jgi:hypothetical protein